MDVVIEGLRYQLQTSEKTAIVLEDDSYQKLTEVNIPERVEYGGTDFSVIGITSGSFIFCSISSVALPSTLKSISEYAFSNCHNIKEVNIPEGCETIGRSAFAYCDRLQKVVLPATLSSLGDLAFEVANGLNFVVSHSKSPCRISENVFCKKLLSVMENNLCHYLRST